VGAVTGFTIWYAICHVYVPGAILITATLLSTLVLCIILYTRIRARQRWQAEWERDARVDLSYARDKNRGQTKEEFHAGPQSQAW
jgi:hypothetical protein